MFCLKACFKAEKLNSNPTPVSGSPVHGFVHQEIGRLCGLELVVIPVKTFESKAFGGGFETPLEKSL